MVTRLWVFPDGQPFDLGNLDKEIHRVKGLTPEQVLPNGEHTIPVVGMVEYRVSVGDNGILLSICSLASRKVLATFMLPHQGISAPIMSSKGPEDPNMYIFALLEVTRS